MTWRLSGSQILSWFVEAVTCQPVTASVVARSSTLCCDEGRAVKKHSDDKYVVSTWLGCGTAVHRDSSCDICSGEKIEHCTGIHIEDWGGHCEAFLGKWCLLRPEGKQNLVGKRRQDGTGSLRMLFLQPGWLV